MRWLLVPVLVLAVGCGPTAREQRERTLSLLNTEADRWDGGAQFATDAVDAYGRPLSCRVRNTTLDHVLEVRSHGPDGMPQNSDDLVVSRRIRHGETTLTEQAGKAAEEISGKAAAGAVKGIQSEIRRGDGKP